MICHKNGTPQNVEFIYLFFHPIFQNISAYSGGCVFLRLLSNYQIFILHLEVCYYYDKYNECELGDGCRFCQPLGIMRIENDK